MNIKVPQLAHLLVTLVGAIGVPEMAKTWISKPSHMAVYVTLVGISTLLHAISPGIFGGPSQQAQDETSVVPKEAGRIAVIAFLMLSGLTAFAQTKPTPETNLQNIYAAGVSYNAGGTPAVAGTGLYAHLVGDSGTYAFTAIDALPNTLKAFTVTTNIGVGVAQKVATIGKFPIYIPSSAGVSFNGSNTGWQWNAGGAASIHIKGQYYVMPTVRVVKSSVSNGTGYQPIVGILFAWGQ